MIDKVLDKLLSNDAAGLALLVLLLGSGVLYRLYQQQRLDRKEEVAKLALALTALADSIQKLQLEIFARKGSR